MVNDANDGEITGIGLTAGGFAGSRTANADHPIARHTTDRINGHLLGAAIEHNLKMLVFKIRDAIGGHQWFDDFANQHLSGPLPWRM